jgi:hypothetical protein
VVQEQERQDAPLTALADPEGAIAVADLEWSEQVEVHGGRVRLVLPTLHRAHRSWARNGREWVGCSRRDGA